MAYECIIRAEAVTHYLKTDFGAVSSQYENEEEYLNGILNYVMEIENDIEDYLDSWSILDETDVDIFLKRINEVKEFIKRTINTPLKERGEPAL
ncbi:hypothetical protein MNBD_NITROSPIRAE02-1567 [hydrothermal vent metagenome]|uniref:Uncharacterized protein n=1 Tax=hydrothermal vent metagenome TaxID=652676 RepID=A0A3B1D4H3_9ZZZZ